MPKHTIKIGFVRYVRSRWQFSIRQEGTWPVPIKAARGKAEILKIAQDALLQGRIQTLHDYDKDGNYVDCTAFQKRNWAPNPDVTPIAETQLNEELRHDTKI
jgi:hypothetical protein|tara:strand:+ start:234 stop:539 length:306 start_codon:yes stop_codon:yes gene_type:complete